MKTNELANFVDSVNTLIEGKLILVDKHIASVLQCVATSQILCKALSDTLKTMTYSTEFSRARVAWTRSDGVVEARLKLPADRNRLFTFVVCLLTEVDSGRRNILDFLKEYYNDVNNDASYARFANEVLKPFKSAGEHILSSIDPEGVNVQYVEQAEKFFKAEKIYIDTRVLNQLFGEMDAIRRILEAQKLSEGETFEVSAATEYFVNALYLKNPKILAVSYLAYKNAVGRYSATIEHVKVIVQLLSSIAM
ncbi:MAG: hypothetical protein J1F66_02235 [Clostridiales bacterium]|nr:hypothetical protein [Clostridiales bacterium]